MRPSPSSAALAALALLAAGCLVQPRAPAHAVRLPRSATDFTPSSGLEPPARSRSCHVDVVFDGEPARPYVVIGRVSASWIGQGRVAQAATEAVVLPLLRREACRAGAHVIFRVVTDMQDHLGPRPGGAWLARSARGSAGAGVYVLPGGAVGPPPAGPGRVVRSPGGAVSDESPSPPDRPRPVGPLEIADPWAD